MGCTIRKLQVCIEMRLLLLTLLLQVKSQESPSTTREGEEVFVVLSLTLQLKRPTRLEGGPTEGWRLMSSTPLMFAALHPSDQLVVLVSIVPSVGEPVSGNVWTANHDGKCMTALLQYMLIPI